MEKAILFSAGERGNIVYKKMILFFDVIAYSDNNESLWGKTCNGVTIIPPSELPGLVEKKKAKIFIINEKYWADIARQLDGLGIHNYINLDSYLSYVYDEYLWMPISFSKPKPFKKENRNNFTVLYVQDKPNTRTCKMAIALKNKGIATYAAYTASPSDVGLRAFVKEYPFWTWTDLIDFVNESEFDVVHCSEMPCELVNLLLYSNKKIIFDMHDCTTCCTYYTSASSLLEYMATRQADGVIYTSEKFRDVQIKKYGIKKEKTFVIGNYPLSSFSKVKRKPKLSAADGEIHCVFEGMLMNPALADLSTYGDYSISFIRLAQRGIHTHIYSYSFPEYCRSIEEKSEFIHYEGNIRDESLIHEISQYDVGLLLFGNPDSPYCKITNPNKFSEYLSAGLPVASNVPAYIELLEKINGGGALDICSDNVRERLNEIRSIYIADDFCSKHKFTVESYIDELLAFYKKTAAIK